MLADIETDSDKPGVEEIYERAANASSLKHEPERRTAGDVLRDMAMSADRLGGLLLRLRSQWESTMKPERQRTRPVKEWAEILPKIQNGTRKVKDRATGSIKEEPVMVPDMDSARLANDEERERLDGWYETEVLRLVTRLADLPAARDLVAVQAAQWKMAEPDVKAVATIRYWLDQTCPVCQGRKWQNIAGTPGLSTKLCPDCRGVGVSAVPHGQEGRRLANYMDMCVQKHRDRSRARRKAFSSIPAIDRLSKRMQPDDNVD